MIMSKQEFLMRSGLEAGTLDVWLEQQWLIAEGANFSDCEVARARLIQALKSDFGVNDEGIDVILHLIDQLHGLRQALAHLHEGGRG